MESYYTLKKNGYTRKTFSFVALISVIDACREGVTNIANEIYDCGIKKIDSIVKDLVKCYENVNEELSLLNVKVDEDKRYWKKDFVENIMNCYSEFESVKSRLNNKNSIFDDLNDSLEITLNSIDFYLKDFFNIESFIEDDRKRFNPTTQKILFKNELENCPFLSKTLHRGFRTVGDKRVIRKEGILVRGKVEEIENVMEK